MTHGSERRRGWLLVGAQFLLLAGLGWLALAAGPSSPRSPWSLIGLAAIGCGVAVCLLAARTLGRSLSANPVPVTSGSLRTDGPYRLVRHPIYGGLLLLGWGAAVWSATWAALVLAVALTGLLTAKALWEEQLLRSRYPDYDKYAKRTGRFVPRLRPSR
jgi:protein-S-isoprenylcysteine O-methyltransferase Ste14